MPGHNAHYRKIKYCDIIGQLSWMNLIPKFQDFFSFPRWHSFVLSIFPILFHIVMTFPKKSPARSRFNIYDLVWPLRYGARSLKVGYSEDHHRSHKPQTVAFQVSWFLISRGTGGGLPGLPLRSMLVPDPYQVRVVPNPYPVRVVPDSSLVRVNARPCPVRVSARPLWIIKPNSKTGSCLGRFRKSLRTR